MKKKIVSLLLCLVMCLSLLPVTALADNGTASVVARNAVSTSNAAKPTITTQPKNVSVSVGQTATFKVTASGSGLTYQWYYQVPGESSWTKVANNGTSATYKLTAAARHNGYTYTCKVSNSAGQVWSGNAVLTVNGAKPAITTQPKNVSVSVGQTATFKVAASGSGLKYQWYYQAPGESSWTKVANNGTSASYSLTAAARHNAYTYTCKVSNSAGQVWSGNAVLTVSSAKPTITTQPKNVSVNVGETATFTVAASGSGLKYQWYYQKPGSSTWTAVSTNGTSATYKLTAAERHNGYTYTCKVSNSAGQVWSGNAKLTVDLTVKYRALLVGEVNFSWETANRNHGDVLILSDMLRSVKGPTGGSYEVTCKYDLSNSGIQRAIANTFKNADANDVSLFFLATHGVVDVASGPYAGELITIGSNGDEYLTLGELAGWLKKVPGKVIVLLGSCGSGAAIVENGVVSYVAANTAKAFNTAAVSAFAAVDEILPGTGEVSNTGEFRNSKFYVLTAAAHQEASWGYEGDSPDNSFNFFPLFFALGATGDKPADTNGNGVVTLKEMYNYIKVNTEDVQHVQMYPANSGYGLFK